MNEQTMVQNHVTVFNDNTALVTKMMYDAEFAVTVYVMKYKNTVILVRDDIPKMAGYPCVMLVKKKATESEAYNKWMYLIGKMCKRDESSKYFSNDPTHLHFSNGDRVSTNEQNEITEFILKEFADIR